MSADPAVFVGDVDADGVIHLDAPQRLRAYLKAKLTGQSVDVIITVHGTLKTRLQEKGFHAMITPWAREEGLDVDGLKRDLLRAVFGEAEHVNRLTGEVSMALREPHTSTLTRAQYSELIERTLDLAAGCGQILVAPQEYRERKQVEAEQQAKA